MKTLAELQKLTLNWSEARGITTNGKAITQVVKLTEEICETLVALNTDDTIESKDGLGDSLVVCCNLGALIDSTIDFELLKNRAYAKDEKLFESLLYSFGKLNKTVNAGNFIEADAWLQEVVIALYGIANYIDSSPEECWTLAYNVIKDRKGYLTPEGNFIKESDL